MKNPAEHLSADALGDLVQSGGKPDDVINATQHLRECSDCRRLYLQLSRIDRVLHRLPLPQLGREFTHGVMTTIAPAAAGRYGFRLLVGGASVMIALVGAAFVIAGYLVLSRLLGNVPSQRGSTAVEQGVSAIGTAVQWCTLKLNGYLKGSISVSAMRTGLLAVTGTAFVVILDRVIARTFRRKVGLER